MSPVTLPPCPPRPNCACSTASDPRHAVAPIAFATTGERAHEALLAALRDLPRTRVTLDAPRHVRAECRSLVFRFVDDLECVIDEEAGIIHVRSAARTGYWDLGVNRRRVERLRRDVTSRLAR